MDGMSIYRPSSFLDGKQTGQNIFKTRTWSAMTSWETIFSSGGGAF
jgi:hypothetical protein